MPTNSRPPKTPDRISGAILTLVLALLAVAAGPIRALPQAEAQPATDKASPQVIEFDLGTVVTGNPATHQFMVPNPGDEPMTILRVVPDGGCSVVDFDHEIPPGGQGKVTVSLDTEVAHGTGTAWVEVYAEGQPEPVARLGLKFNVVSKLGAFPGFARWIYVQHEGPGTISQTIFSTDGQDFDITGVDSPRPFIKITYRKATEDERREGHAGSQWHLESTIMPDAKVGAITGAIVVHTNHPEQKTLRIPASGFVRPMLFLEPQRGHLGTVDLDNPKPVSFRVRNFADENVALNKAETDVPGVTAKIVPSDPGHEYWIVLEFDPAVLEQGPFSGTLTVETDSKAVPVLTAPFSGRASKGADDSKH